MPAAGDIGLCGKFLWGSMVKFQKTSCDFLPTPTRTEERQDFVELGAFELNLAFFRR
jgi:hypothetical protein